MRGDNNIIFPCPEQNNLTGQHGPYLLDLIRARNPDINQIIDIFVDQFNTVYGTTGVESWDVTKEEWQRYEFLGDRVLNLIIVQNLFSMRDAILDEGEMTRILARVVSNRALDAYSQTLEKKIFDRLIPDIIRNQGAFGPRITGGAFEAFVGCLYCELGLDEVAGLVNTILIPEFDAFSTDENTVGYLQEYFQKQYNTLPDYREILRTGPEHKPKFTYQVFHSNRQLGEGSGETIQAAKQAAAKDALAKTEWKL